MNVLALDDEFVLVDTPQSRESVVNGLRIRRTCDFCGDSFLVYPSIVKRELERGRIGPRFCGSKCFEATRTGPKCVKCGGPNLRGRRTRICQECMESSPNAVKLARARMRRAECPPDKRWCTKCDEFLPPAQFNSADHICSACQRAQNLSGHLRRDFGITDDEYQQLLDAQGGKCAICGSAPRTKRLNVDHNHKTLQIRGLLCHWCNHRLLGGARDRVEVLRSAVAYLEHPPAEAAIGERFTTGRRQRPGRMK